MKTVIKSTKPHIFSIPMMFSRMFGAFLVEEREPTEAVQDLRSEVFTGGVWLHYRNDLQNLSGDYQKVRKGLVNALDAYKIEVLNGSQKI